MRFVKFAIVGVLNTAVTFAVFNLTALGLGLPPLWANAIGWAAGFANSFAWNRRWTFADRKAGSLSGTLARFAAANLLALGVSTLIVAALDATLEPSQGAGHSATTLNAIEAAAVIVALCVNYLVSSRWVFRSRDTSDPTAESRADEPGQTGPQPPRDAAETGSGSRP